MDALVLVDRIDDLVHNAPQGLLSSRVRVDSEALLADVDALREAVRRELAHPEGSGTWPLIDRLEALVLAAEPARLLRGVRLSPDDAYDILDLIRATLPEDLSRR